MYILNERKMEIINTDYVERFDMVEKTDAALIVASYGRTNSGENREKQAITIGRYKDKTEAMRALADLFDALRYGEDSFEMPPSLYYDEERIKKDARTKRKGGS